MIRANHETEPSTLTCDNGKALDAAAIKVNAAQGRSEDYRVEMSPAFSQLNYGSVVFPAAYQPDNTGEILPPAHQPDNGGGVYHNGEFSPRAYQLDNGDNMYHGGEELSSTYQADHDGEVYHGHNMLASAYQSDHAGERYHGGEDELPSAYQPDYCGDVYQGGEVYPSAYQSGHDGEVLPAPYQPDHGGEVYKGGEVLPASYQTDGAGEVSPQAYQPHHGGDMYHAGEELPPAHQPDYDGEVLPAAYQQDDGDMVSSQAYQPNHGGGMYHGGEELAPACQPDYGGEVLPAAYQPDDGGEVSAKACHPDHGGGMYHGGEELPPVRQPDYGGEVLPAAYQPENGGEMLLRNFEEEFSGRNGCIDIPTISQATAAFRNEMQPDSFANESLVATNYQATVADYGEMNPDSFGSGGQQVVPAAFQTTVAGASDVEQSISLNNGGTVEKVRENSKAGLRDCDLGMKMERRGMSAGHMTPPMEQVAHPMDRCLLAVEKLLSTHAGVLFSKPFVDLERTGAGPGALLGLVHQKLVQGRQGHWLNCAYRSVAEVWVDVERIWQRLAALCEERSTEGSADLMEAAEQLQMAFRAQWVMQGLPPPPDPRRISSGVDLGNSGPSAVAGHGGGGTRWAGQEEQPYGAETPRKRCKSGNMAVMRVDTQPDCFGAAAAPNDSKPFAHPAPSPSPNPSPPPPRASPAAAGTRCEACIRLKKGRCGTESSPLRCDRRAAAGLPYVRPDGTKVVPPGYQGPLTQVLNRPATQRKKDKPNPSDNLAATAPMSHPETTSPQLLAAQQEEMLQAQQEAAAAPFISEDMMTQQLREALEEDQRLQAEHAECCRSHEIAEIELRTRHDQLVAERSSREKDAAAIRQTLQGMMREAERAQSAKTAMEAYMSHATSLRARLQDLLVESEASKRAAMLRPHTVAGQRLVSEAEYREFWIQPKPFDANLAKLAMAAFR